MKKKKGKKEKYSESEITKNLSNKKYFKQTFYKNIN